MQRPLQISFRDIEEAGAIEAHIRQKVEKLEEFYSHVIGCHVVVEMQHRHKHQGKSYHVRIEAKVPGGEINVTREADIDVYVALRDAFDAMKREIEDYSRRQRGDVKTHEIQEKGVVARLFEEGYGFIATDSGDELYFSRDNVASPDFDHLEIGEEVHFLSAMGAEGPQAKRVTAGRRPRIH